MAPPPDYHAIAAQKAAQYGVPVSVFLKQIGQESGFSPTAHSSAGADGIAQFIPSTAKAYGVNTRDPVSSLDGAARMDATLIKQYGSVARALSAYNSGKPDAYKDPGFAGGQTYNYVRSILGGTAPGGGGTAAPLPASPPAAGAPAPPAPVDRTAGLLKALGSGDDLGGFYRQLGSALRARNAPPVAPQPDQQPAAPTGGYSGPGGQVLGATQGENGGFLASLQKLAGYEHAPVQINSGFRSTAKQAQLYANRASNPNPVAPPGSSLHEKGLAADGTIGGKPIGTLPPKVLAMFGLRSVPGDPVHVQAIR